MTKVRMSQRTKQKIIMWIIFAMAMIASYILGKLSSVHIEVVRTETEHNMMIEKVREGMNRMLDSYKIKERDNGRNAKESRAAY